MRLVLYPRCPRKGLHSRESQSLVAPAEDNRKSFTPFCLSSLPQSSSASETCWHLGSPLGLWCNLSPGDVRPFTAQTKPICTVTVQPCFQKAEAEKEASYQVVTLKRVGNRRQQALESSRWCLTRTVNQRPCMPHKRKWGFLTQRCMLLDTGTQTVFTWEQTTASPFLLQHACKRVLLPGGAMGSPFP